MGTAGGQRLCYATARSMMNHAQRDYKWLIADVGQLPSKSVYIGNQTLNPKPWALNPCLQQQRGDDAGARRQRVQQLHQFPRPHAALGIFGFFHDCP